MNWTKKGVIFRVDHQYPWMVSHACVPTALLVGDRIRLYVASRSAQNQSYPVFIEVAAADPTRVLYVHDRPILPLGELGTFDDGGLMPCSVETAADGRVFLYYVGWNPSGSVPYRNAIGLAISEDGGVTFARACPGAIVDRNMQEPFFTASPRVLRQGDRWHMWYASATRFVTVEGKVEPVYVIKYGASDDGIHWRRDNVTCIEPHSPEEANARPSVLFEDGIYKMVYCYRGSRDYRDGPGSYRLGYAESRDAVHWTRLDDQVGITFSPEGWDSKMLAYPDWIKTPYGTYLFYNGNGFGATGIGYAVLQEAPAALP